MKLISIVTPCFNEEANVQEVYEQVKAIFKTLPKYRYEHIFIDNASKDNTVSILKSIARQDKNIKIIVNSRNFGWIKSPHYALLQAKGDAVILLVADLQDSPELIREFIGKWEEGYKIVVGIKPRSEESPVFLAVRKLYYWLINSISEIELIPNFMGFGLYDKKIMDILKQLDDPYPYFRGLISEIGFEVAKIEYTQRSRKKGITSSNFYRLFDVALLAMTSYSKVPLRIATIFGFMMSLLSNTRWAWLP
jgi:polyisoprenyl-phosphate glycosyltransferase